MAISSTQIRAARTRDKKMKLTDGGGLYVEVLPSGRKTFRLVYRLNCRQKDVMLGRFGDLKLEEARNLRDTARSMLARGEDPANIVSKRGAAKKPKEPESKEPKKASDSWSVVADAYLQYRKRSGMHPLTSAKLERQVRQTSEAFGLKRVSEITAADILNLVRPIEDSGKRVVAHELRSRCSQILDYAEAIGFPNTNPARKVTTAMLPRKRGGFPGLTDPRKVGKLMRDIRAFQNCEPETRWGLLLSAYLFPRSEQLRGATWAEVDLDAAIWEVPSIRMKGTDAFDHIVPLPRQVLAILEESAELNGREGYLVPSPRGPKKKMSDMVFNMALRRMGYCTKTEHCQHGFRVTASTILNEMGYNRDWIERQLSHVEENAVRMTYNKAQYLEGRTAMMQAYSDRLDELARDQ